MRRATPSSEDAGPRAAYPTLQVPGQFVGVRLGSGDDKAGPADAEGGRNGSTSGISDGGGHGAAAPSDAAAAGNSTAPDAGGNAATALLPIASSPIDARADSSLLDASIIEVPVLL